MNRSVVRLAALMVALPQAGWAAASDRDAPAPEAVRLSLAETIDRARAHSARLAQLSALETAADAALRGARANRLPTLDVGTSYTRNSNVPELTIALPGMDPRTIFPNIPDNFRARAGLGVALYTGGRVEGGITAAEHSRAAAARDVEGGVQDLVLEASTAYWQLVTSRESARVLAEAVASYEAHLKESRDRFDYGMAARNEVLAVQVQRDRAELNRLVAVNSAEIANANLIRLVGLSPNARRRTSKRSSRRRWAPAPRSPPFGRASRPPRRA